MQFFSTATIVALGLISQALSLPLSQRQSGTVDVAKAAVKTATDAANSDMAAMMAIVTKSGADEASIASAVKSASSDMTSQFKAAGASIASSTTGAGTTLSAPEMTALTSAMNAATMMGASLQATSNTLASTMKSDTLAVALSEWKAAAAAFWPFAQPLYTLAGQVAGAGSGTGGSTTTDMKNAAANLQSIAAALAAAGGVGRKL